MCLCVCAEEIVSVSIEKEEIVQEMKRKREKEIFKIPSIN